MGVSEAVVGKTYPTVHRDRGPKHLLREFLIGAGLICRFGVDDQYSNERVTNIIFRVAT